MPNTIILIRCVEFDRRIEEMIQAFNSYLQGWTVLAVPDLLGKSDSEIDDCLAEFPIDTLPITDDFIRNHGLHYAHEGAQTGWLCGDYALYRALEKDWDYAWIVEPDVFFLNGAEDYLKRFQLLDHDLLATNVWPTGRHWMWGRALDDVVPELSLGAMAFPLLRCSRELALDALGLRRQIARKLREETLFPNDEVVVATAARENGRRSLNIVSLFEEGFRYFGTEVKKNVDDLQKRHSDPLVVHAGRRREQFSEFLEGYWNGAMNGNQARKRQFLSALGSCDVDTIVDFFNKTL